MRIVGCGLIGLIGLIAAMALLGTGPAAMAGEVVDPLTPPPPAGVSVLAVSLTAGGAVAAVSSGVVLALTRRRQSINPPVDQPASQSTRR